MKLGDYQFTDSNGDTWNVDSDGNEMLVSQGDTPTANDWGTATGTVVTTYAPGPAPTAAQQAAVVAADPSKPADVSWLATLAAAVPKALQLYNAQQIAAVNIKRAQSGLAPLNAGLYGPQVGVGMDPATSQLLLYGAIGIGAVMLIGGKKKKR